MADRVYEILHGGHASEGSFLGGDAAIIAAAWLHTLGALLWAAGSAGILGWAREVFQGHHGRATWRVAQFAVWLGIGCNFLGGTLRLFEPGHPELHDIDGSGWVRIIFAKHVLLVAALVASAIVLLRSAPRLLADFLGGRDTARGARTVRRLCWAVLGCILVATVLGAASTVALE